MDLPGKDSWIALEAGQSVKMDASMLLDWHQQTDHFRRVRGIILAVCYEIEYQIDRIISAAFFPPLEPDPARLATETKASTGLRALFTDFFLKSRNALRFDAKLSLLERLIAALSWQDQGVVPKDLVASLRNVQKMRSKFAHYPVTFKPDAQRRLQAFLVFRDGEVLLRDPYLKQIGDLINAVSKGVSDLASRLNDIRRSPGRD